MRRACPHTCSSCHACYPLRQVRSCASTRYSVHKQFPAGPSGTFFRGQEETTIAMSRQNQFLVIFYRGTSVAGTQSRLRSTQQWQSGRAALCVLQFELCILLICIIVATVPFVCCSVKLPLFRHTSFCLFLSVLLCTPAGGGAATWCFCCWPKLNYNSLS